MDYDNLSGYDLTTVRLLAIIKDLNERIAALEAV